MNWNVVSAIFKKEMKSFFGSPMAYIVLSVFLIITGWFFTLNLFKENLAHLRSIFDILPFLLVIYAPAISMRLIAEERKSGTMELLVTMPVRDFDLIFGKFLAAFVLYAVGLAFTLIYALTVIILGNAELGPMFAGYVGLLLCGGVYIAFGVLGSALTENQIVAFILSFLLSGIFAILIFSAMIIPAPFADIVQYLSTTYHFQNIARGVIDSRDVIYFLSLMFLSLLLSSRAIAQRKFL
ncbi:MAG: ABC transporter permease [Candidatus Electryonea clarkiae]|nr:ABC transporter permease [Candidatus Electryonea clarkiae]MDP8285127.1 ABC transporter permease [Candidatus Electryonea clarkiae]